MLSDATTPAPAGETTDGAPAAAPAPSQKRLTGEQWLEAEALYLTGQANGAEISRRYGVSASAVSQRFNAKGLRYGSLRPEVEAKTREKVVEKVSGKAAEAVSAFAEARRRRIEETKEAAYRYQETTDKQLAGILAEVAKNRAAAAAGTPIPGAPVEFGSVFHSVRALALAKKAFAIGRAERWAILEIEGDVAEEELPSLVVQDLTAEEVQEMRSNSSLAMGDEVEEDGDAEADPESGD